MARSIENAAEGFIASQFFKKGVESKDYSEIRKQIVELLQAYHTAICVQAPRVYGKVRWSGAEVIKPALRNMDYVKVEWYRK